VADLSHFDFANPIFRGSGSASLLQERPMQKCRALISQNGISVGLSNLVNIVISRPAIAVQNIFVAPQAGLENPLLQKFVYAKPVEIARYRLKNPDSITRRLRIAKRRLRVAAQLFFEIKMQDRTTAVYKMLYPEISAVSLAPAAPEAANIQENETSYTVTLPPQGQVTVLGIFQSLNHSVCAVDKVHGILLSGSEPLAIEELDRDEQVFTTFDLQTGPYTLFRPDLAMKYQWVQKAPPCDWF
jgi:hypothetical protein